MATALYFAYCVLLGLFIGIYILPTGTPDSDIPDDSDSYGYWGES